MEVVLNLAGAFVAFTAVCLWLRWAPHVGHGRRTQLVALSLLILILFPVISVTDDLLAAQNPAETDSALRRDHVISSLHSVSSDAAGLPDLPVAEVPFGFLLRAAPGTLRVPTVNFPAFAPVENRPPPTA